MSEKFITYYRVSTADQGRSGLGLEAQRKTVEDYLNGNGHEIVGEYTEIESGGKNDRPELQKALKACRLKKARLIVSKLDRLSRDLHFITELQQAKVRFVIAEMPDATEMTIHIYAALAQHERKVISQRTKDALAVRKAQGVKLGNPHLGKGNIPTAKMIEKPGGDTTNANNARQTKANAYAQDMASVINEAKEVGCDSLRDIADYLNNTGYKTARGGEWHATSVARVLERVGGR